MQLSAAQQQVYQQQQAPGSLHAADNRTPLCLYIRQSPMNPLNLPDSSNIVAVAYLVCVDVVDPNALGCSDSYAAIVLVECNMQQARFMAA
jgi:hypothetical protein